MGKLTKVHILVIGILINILVAVGMFYLLVKPAKEARDQAQQQYEARKAVADQFESAKRDLEKARLENLQAKIDWNYYETRKMPPISFADRTQGMIAFWKERAEVLGPMLRSWPRKFGVELETDISIDPASADPNSYKDELMTLDLKDVTVRGDYFHIMKHMEGWNRFGRLVQISPPSLEGVSPNLTAKYNLKVHMFPRGPFGTNVAQAAAGTAGSSGTTPGPSVSMAPSPGPSAGAPPPGPSGGNPMSPGGDSLATSEPTN